MAEAARVHHMLLWGLVSWIMSLGFLTWVFYRKHHKMNLGRFLRGNYVEDVRTLARRLKWTRQASTLKLGPLPLVKNTEMNHILLSGTTGAGKSNAFHTLLPQIRKRGDPAIVIDVEGTLTSHYYREGHDILLNPFDLRSDHWDMWAELESEPLYEVFTDAVIPPLQGSSDPFWINAPRKVLLATLDKFKQQGETSIRKLYEQLVYADGKEFEAFFKGTEAATYSKEKGEKFTQSIRASLEIYTKFFKYLPAYQGGRKISLRQWIRSEPRDQWIFITVKQDWFKVMKPLISGWCDLATSALLSLPESETRRLWFVLDELPALQALPSLEDGLTRARKFGGCIIAAVQNFKQLTKTYGQVKAEIMIDLFNTKVFFRNEEPNTTAWISRLLGEREETEMVQNVSYGSRTDRDNLSLNQQTKRHTLVLPTEIAMLRDLEAYVKLPGHYPITKFRFPWSKPKTIAVDFIERPQELNQIPQKIEPDQDVLSQQDLLDIKTISTEMTQQLEQGPQDTVQG